MRVSSSKRRRPTTFSAHQSLCAAPTVCAEQKRHVVSRPQIPDLFVSSLPTPRIALTNPPSFEACVQAVEEQVREEIPKDDKRSAFALLLWLEKKFLAVPKSASRSSAVNVNRQDHGCFCFPPHLLPILCALQRHLRSGQDRHPFIEQSINQFGASNFRLDFDLTRNKQWIDAFGAHGLIDLILQAVKELFPKRGLQATLLSASADHYRFEKNACRTSLRIIFRDIVAKQIEQRRAAEHVWQRIKTWLEDRYPALQLDQMIDMQIYVGTKPSSRMLEADRQHKFTCPTCEHAGLDASDGHCMSVGRLKCDTHRNEQRPMQAFASLDEQGRLIPSMDYLSFAEASFITPTRLLLTESDLDTIQETGSEAQLAAQLALEEVMNRTFVRGARKGRRQGSQSPPTAPRFPSRELDLSEYASLCSMLQSEFLVRILGPHVRVSKARWTAETKTLLLDFPSQSAQCINSKVTKHGPGGKYHYSNRSFATLLFGSGTVFIQDYKCGELGYDPHRFFLDPELHKRATALLPK